MDNMNIISRSNRKSVETIPEYSMDKKMENAKNSFMGAVTLLVGLSLSYGVAESAERLPVATPVINGGQKMVVPDLQKSFPSASTAVVLPPAYSPPKVIFVSGTLSAVGPRVDTSPQRALNPPKSANGTKSHSGFGSHNDISFDPPKNITVTTPLTAVGPR
jgi:hypothetical protein